MKSPPPPSIVVIKSIKRIVPYIEKRTALWEIRRIENSLISNRFSIFPSEGFALGTIESRMSGTTGKCNSRFLNNLTTPLLGTAQEWFCLYNNPGSECLDSEPGLFVFGPVYLK